MNLGLTKTLEVAVPDSSAATLHSRGLDLVPRAMDVFRLMSLVGAGRDLLSGTD